MSTVAARLQPAVCFELGPERYAVPRDRVAGVAALDVVERVPGTPPGIFGLWRRDGHVHTVLDLPGLLLRDSFEGASWGVRLLPPFPFIALRVPAGLTMRPLPLEPPGDGWLTPLQYEGRRIHRVELQALVDLVVPATTSD